MNRTLRWTLALALSSAVGCKCTATLPEGPGSGSSGDGGVRDGSVITLEDPDAGPGGDGGSGPDSGPSTTLGPGHWTDDPDAKTEGVKPDKDGNLTLDSSDVKLHFAWLANPDGHGTISKIDTTTGKEVARYLATIPVDGKGTRTGLVYARPNSPSRTAVDIYGDVWVANRAFGIQGSVTKIANARQDCVDRNGDGKIQTSEDSDGNGIISGGEMITPSDPNDEKTYDECVLFSTPIGSAGQPVVARALAIDSNMDGRPGNVWVGLWCGLSGTASYDGCESGGGAFVKLDPRTGELLEVAPGQNWVKVPIKPYGAAVDASNRVWFSMYNHTWTAFVDANTGAASPRYAAPSDWGGYGMTVQVVNGKTRVWIANIDRHDSISAFDPDSATWTQWDFRSQLGTQPFGRARGVAVDSAGTVWISSYYDNEAGSPGCSGGLVARLLGIDSQTGTVKDLPVGGKVMDFSAWAANHGLGSPCNGIGVGLDGQGRVWMASNNGYAMSMNLTSGEVLMSPNVGSLYTYSDFTGYTLRTFTAPRGSYKTAFTGCHEGAKTHWGKLSWSADVPAGSKLQFFAKSAASRTGFDDPGVQRFGPFETSPADLEAAGVPVNRYLQVEAVFLSLDKASKPTLKDLQVTWSCESIFN